MMLVLTCHGHGLTYEFEVLIKRVPRVVLDQLVGSKCLGYDAGQQQK